MLKTEQHPAGPDRQFPGSISRLGLMMDRPLTLPSLLEYAAIYHTDREVVTRTVEGPIHRYHYGDVLGRVKRLANALVAMGVRSGDRVATLAWSTHRHFELYYAVSGIGAILHTINPRLHVDQIVWIANHAEDSVLFYDMTFIEQASELRTRAPLIRTFITLSGNPPAGFAENDLLYEDLINASPADFGWPTLDERQACALCYTSGTTGNPKGVLYSHRSNMLHALSAVAPDAFDLSARSVILPCAQMYHANAWGIPYAAPLVGAKLVLPGRCLDGRSICELIAAEGVTFALGVPTIWLDVLEHLDRTGQDIASVKNVAIGGTAPSEALLHRIEERMHCRVRHLWGMTELSPLGTVNTPLPGKAVPGLELKQGRGLWGIDLRIVDEAGTILPRDGKTPGGLQVRGPWVLSAYFKQDGAQAFTEDGWFDTGDIATLDQDGYLQLTDRAKDIIKSGGEWISSIELENVISSHPAVALAAAIGVPHPKWDERPLLVVTLRPGFTVGPDELKAHVASRVARWWLPEEIRIVDALPIGPTGKVVKRALRDMLLAGGTKHAGHRPAGN